MPATPNQPGRRGSPLASGSVREHLLRGAIGLTAAVLAVALCTVVGPIALLALPVTVVAWRGCPTCWTVGLISTIADDRARSGEARSCPARPSRKRRPVAGR